MCERKNNKGVVIHTKDVERDEVAKGIHIQWLIASEHGSDRIFLRRFVMERGSFMPLHRHRNCEHTQFYLKGKVKVRIDDFEYEVGKGDAVFIPVGTSHSYTNIGDGEAEFLCIVPGVEIDTEMLE